MYTFRREGGSGKQSLTWAQAGFAVKHQTKKYAGNELNSIGRDFSTRTATISDTAV